MSEEKKVSVYFIMCIYIISNMFQLHRQFVHALLAHGTAVGRLCLAESHLAPLVSAWGGVEIPTARMEASYSLVIIIGEMAFVSRKPWVFTIKQLEFSVLCFLQL